jgi:HD-GYP domain-containing protein (c-di-GMP phosphodiesterase class II)
MLTTRVYRPARPAQEALVELQEHTGTQFCPRCVGALEALLATDFSTEPRARQPQLVD